MQSSPCQVGQYDDMIIYVQHVDDIMRSNIIYKYNLGKEIDAGANLL